MNILRQGNTWHRTKSVLRKRFLLEYALRYAMMYSDSE